MQLGIQVRWFREMLKSDFSVLNMHSVKTNTVPYPVCSNFNLFAGKDHCSANNGKGNCSHVCMNTLLSFKCQCPHGYQLGDDGLTCKGEKMVYTIIPKITHMLLAFRKCFM